MRRKGLRGAYRASKGPGRASDARRGPERWMGNHFVYVLSDYFMRYRAFFFEVDYINMSITLSCHLHYMSGRFKHGILDNY